MNAAPSLSASQLDSPLPEETGWKPRSFVSLTVTRLRQDRLTMAALVFLATVVILAVGAEVWSSLLVGVGPNDTNLDSTLQPSYFGPWLQWKLGLDSMRAPQLLEQSQGVTHWLGTDSLGRDQLVRLLHGARISMLIALFGAIIALLLGVVLGMLAGFFGGMIDDVFSWLISTFSSVPTLFVLILVTAIWRPNAITLTLFLGFFGWVGIARFMRGQVLQVKALDYTLAARSIGASMPRVMWHHILPNSIPLILVLATVDIGALILTESILSFLGLGVQPPHATWGSMLAKSQDHLFLIDPDTGRYLAWHLIFPPGILIFVTVLSLFLLGDGLRDAVDPQLQTRS